MTMQPPTTARSHGFLRYFSASRSVPCSPWQNRMLTTAQPMPSASTSTIVHALSAGAATVKRVGGTPIATETRYPTIAEVMHGTSPA